MQINFVKISQKLKPVYENLFYAPACCVVSNLEGKDRYYIILLILCVRS